MWSNQWLCCCYFYLCCCYGYCYFCCCCCCWMLCGSGRPGPTLLIKPRSGVSPGRLHICWQAVRLDAYPAPSNWSSQANFFFLSVPSLSFFFFNFNPDRLSNRSDLQLIWSSPAPSSSSVSKTHQRNNKRQRERVKEREKVRHRDRDRDLGFNHGKTRELRHLLVNIAAEECEQWKK